MVLNPCHSHLAVVRLNDAPTAAGRWLLTKMLKHLRLIGQTDALPEITCTAMGKPFFMQHGLPNFNISHSKTHVAVYLGAMSPVGCDMEQIVRRPGWQVLANEYFSAAETKHLLQLNETDGHKLFWRYWTAREAWLKQQGKSVWDMASLALDINTPSQLSIAGATQALQHLTFQQQQLCLCHSQAFVRMKDCRAFGKGMLISYEHATGANR